MLVSTIESDLRLCCKLCVVKHHSSAGNNILPHIHCNYHTCTSRNFHWKIYFHGLCKRIDIPSKIFLGILDHENITKIFTTRKFPDQRYVTLCLYSSEYMQDSSAGAYPSPLHLIGYHHDDSTILLPDHSPEVTHCCWQAALCGNVPPL